jgi:hypothetical protein
MSPVDAVMYAVNAFPLLCVLTIAVCRVNTMSRGTCLPIKAAYVLVSTGAFSVFISLEPGAEINFALAPLTSGIALALLFDRRKAACYDEPARGVAQ